jgi:hypothetical protein
MTQITEGERRFAVARAAFAGTPWRVEAVLRAPDTYEVQVLLAVDELAFRMARDPAALIDYLAARATTRPRYTGPYAPRAAMRWRAGL